MLSGGYAERRRLGEAAVCLRLRRADPATSEAMRRQERLLTRETDQSAESRASPRCTVRALRLAPRPLARVSHLETFLCFGARDHII